MQKIDTFYVVDFDRCIGDIEASFNIVKEAAHELSIVDRDILLDMRKKTEARGETFITFDHIKNHNSSADFKAIEELYLKKAKNNSDNLLEPGARRFLDYLKKTKRHFCIMSYGDKRWQMVKIKGARIGNVPIVIVQSSNKCDYIKQWFNQFNKTYTIPGEFFSDNQAHVAEKIVLVDDKITAFKNIPEGTSGYLVIGSSSAHTLSHLNEVPKSVKTVTRIDKIIEIEAKLNKT